MAISCFSLSVLLVLIGLAPRADATSIFFQNQCAKSIRIYDKSVMLCSLPARRNTTVHDIFLCKNTLGESLVVRNRNSSTATGTETFPTNLGSSCRTDCGF